MSEIPPIGSPRGLNLPRHGPVDRPESGVTRAESGHDRVEISQAAQLLNRSVDVPQVRLDLVERVRAQIENGTYETPDKLDLALEKLTRDLA